MFIKFRLIVILLFSLFHSSAQLEDNCYLTKNHQNWKLVWADEFEFGSQVNERHWEIEDEVDTCHGNWLQQESCNTRANAAQSSGYLHLNAKYQKHLNFNYTSATITSLVAFTYGRIELRAALPVGRQLRTSFFTINSNDTKWHDNGQIVISTQMGNLDRRVFFAGSSRAEDVAGITEQQTKYSERMNAFHRYGFEWSKEQLVFFFDDVYSEPFKFNATANISSWHRIRLQIGVGLALFKLPMPSNFFELSWKCPTLLVDYIRVFQRVRSVTNLHQCQIEIINKRLESEVIESICDEAMRGMEWPPIEGGVKIAVSGSYVPLYLIIGIPMFILLILVVIYILIQLRQVKQKIESERIKLEEAQRGRTGTYEEDEEIYENIFNPTAAANNFYETQDNLIADWNRELAQMVAAKANNKKPESIKSSEYVPIKGGKIK